MSWRSFGTRGPPPSPRSGSGSTTIWPTNTVLTILRILERKGLAGRQKHGRAHRYRPLLGRAEAGRSILGRLRDKVFCGSAELLMTQLVTEEQLSPDAVRRLRRLLNQQLAAVDRPEQEEEQ